MPCKGHEHQQKDLLCFSRADGLRRKGAPWALGQRKRSRTACLSRRSYKALAVAPELRVPGQAGAGCGQRRQSQGQWAGPVRAGRALGSPAGPALRPGLQMAWAGSRRPLLTRSPLPPAGRNKHSAHHPSGPPSENMEKRRLWAQESETLVYLPQELSK